MTEDTKRQALANAIVLENILSDSKSHDIRTVLEKAFIAGYIQAELDAVKEFEDIHQAMNDFLNRRITK